MKWPIAAVIVTSLLTSSDPSAARVSTRTDLGYSTRTDEDLGAKYLHISVPSPAATTRVAYAELTFEADVAEGVEIELWEDPGDGSRPWERQQSGIDRRLWVTDNRSLNLVRFDVTDLVQGWLKGQANNGVLIRVAPGHGQKDLILETTPNLTFKYHNILRR